LIAERDASDRLRVVPAAVVLDEKPQSTAETVSREEHVPPELVRFRHCLHDGLPEVRSATVTSGHWGVGTDMAAILARRVTLA